MKILITAGGTIEKIDEVRQISNNSTGSLGYKIAETFLSDSHIEKIFYVCGKSALSPPDSDKIEVRRIGNVANLKDTLEQIFSENSIDGVIHCMAVSDYTVKNVTALPLLEQALSEELLKPDYNDPVTRQKNTGIVRQCLTKDSNLAASGKISSDMDDLVIMMEKTPKIIGLIKRMQPRTVLVGFKLLNHVASDYLIKIGYELLKKNNCDFVFANDLADITPDNHCGYLIYPDETFVKLSSRQQIAEKIVLEVGNKIAGKVL